MPQELIHSEYSEIMQKSYIDYAMSVIVQRALPDVRDGLKPVQRRTLYDMYELGIRYNGPYRKSARIVGDTMGKYHPHGDSSIYDALVVMAQDFKKEMPLVDGHGNFGSIEGDGAAAMRYTEARLAKVTQEVFLSDLDKDVVDFVPNFDETEKEPSVLPVRIPNILINGAEGIAVGMATSIPTHNPGEVIDLVINYMKHPDMSTAQAMKYVKGPDFPTGGIVTNKDDLLEIYSTGQGKIKLRGRVETEPGKAGHTKVVVTEIPYTMIGSGIGKFLADTAALQENHLTNDISDISNQSSKEGIRIVIDLKKGADVENFINLLYKKTKLEDTFGVNMLCVCDGRPETLGLVPIIRHHVDFQYELARRKYTTLLNKEREKKEVQEGLIKACDCIDLIIEILRGSKDRAMAENCLVNGVTEGIKFKTAKSEKAAKTLLFTKRQADAILDMRLYRLIGLEIAALRADYDKTMQNIAAYTDILENRDSMTKVIIDDLKKLRKEYAVPRKTTIDNVEEAVVVEKPLEEMDEVILIDRFGYARGIDTATYERNKEAADNESKRVIFCKNTDKLIIFTDTGKADTLRVLDLPLGKFRDKGQPVDNVSNFDGANERAVFVAPLSEIIEKEMYFVTKRGMIKKVAGSEFDSTRKTIAATKLRDDDSLVAVDYATSGTSVVINTENGYHLRLEADDFPSMHKTSVGNTGIRLHKGDSVEEAVTLPDDSDEVQKYNVGKPGGTGSKK